MAMYWYDVGVWKQTDKLYVYDAGQWKDVKNCWIYDNGQWRLCLTEQASLTSFSIFDFGGGTLYAEWSYSATYTSDWEIKIDHSSDGISWSFADTFALTDGAAYLYGGNPYNRYRCRMISTIDNATQAGGSPIIIFPPYPT